MNLETLRIGKVPCSTSTIEEVLLYISEKIQKSESSGAMITCINAHIFNLVQEDPLLRRYLEQSSLVTADGMSIVWAGRLLGYPITERCNMTELFREFLQSDNMPQSTALLIGCSDSELIQAKKSIKEAQSHCTIVASFHGYYDILEYKKKLEEYSYVDFVFVGMGTPRSEELLSQIQEWFPKMIGWHIGGGTIKMLAGTMIEAPEWMRKSGLQWLHRLISEPKTLWKRYLLGNMRFVSTIILIKVKMVLKRD